MKTETSEWYRTDKGKLILMEQRYHSQGAGLPSTTDYKFKYENNIFTLYDINKPFDEITYRTGAVIANHRLSIAGKEKPFLSFSDPREALSFKVEQTSIIKLLIWRCMYG